MGSVLGVPGTMRALKAATAAHHERLERRVDVEARVRSRASYLELLERFYGFYRPLEERLAPWAVPVEPKLPRLVADIDALGGDVRALPLARRLPQVGSVEDALGVHYVVEGATLGGAVIARLARRNLGVEPAFFGGPGIARHWRAFGELVERMGASRTAAVACFEDMEAWLCR